MDSTVLDGLVATGHSDGKVRIWSSKQFSLLWKFDNLHAEAVTSLCINPITCTVTSVSRDHSIKLIDYKSNKVLDELWPDEYWNIAHSSESISCGNYFQKIVVASGNWKILILSIENAKVLKASQKDPIRRAKSISNFNELVHSRFMKKDLELKQQKCIDINLKKLKKFSVKNSLGLPSGNIFLC